MNLRIGALVVSCVLPLAVAAQSNGERVSSGQYIRSHDYDRVHQIIEVRDFDWDSTAFNGRVTTTLVALRPGLDSVILDAGKLLTIRRVTNAGGAALKFTARGDSLIVFPAKPVAFHDTTTFTIDYR